METAYHHVVDVVLASALRVGSSIGSQFGARFSLRLHAGRLGSLLAVIALLPPPFNAGHERGG
jgi:uncharacterized membrane protein YfcA